MVPFDPQFYALVILPVFIFLARIADVSMGTLRIILISRGVKELSTAIAFFEILIWLMAVSQIMSNLNNPLYYIAYAAGFAAGTYIGVCIESRLSIGNVILRIIVRENAQQVAKDLMSGSSRVTVLDGRSSAGRVKLILAVVKRRNVESVINIVKKRNPHVFYSVEDVRSVRDDVLPVHREGGGIFRLGVAKHLHFRNAKSK